MSNRPNVGISFGLTSGIITTLGLMVGLLSGTESRLAVIGGILTIAVTDAFSDALGIHLAEELRGISDKNVWKATGITLLSKFLFSAMFLVPVLILELRTAVLVSCVAGLVILFGYSYIMEKKGEEGKPLWVAMEHTGVGVLVVVFTYFLGEWIARVFG